MTIFYINTGTSANKGNGDTLRNAFWKINANFGLLTPGAISTDFVGNILGNSLLNGLTVAYNTATGTAAFSINIASTSTSGGIKVGSGLSINTSTGVLSVSGIFDSITVENTATIGTARVLGTIYQGTQSSVTNGFLSADTVMQADANIDNNVQSVMQNHNSGTAATTNIVLLNDKGNDSTHFVNLGINSTTYAFPGYELHSPGSSYLFANNADLVIGTGAPGNKLVFHAGGTGAGDSAAELNDYAWVFNRSVEVKVATPGPLDFTVSNTSFDLASSAVFQALNDAGAFIRIGVGSSAYSFIETNAGPNESFIHSSGVGDTMHIGSKSTLNFYANTVTGSTGLPALKISHVDQSTTIGGNLIFADASVQTGAAISKAELQLLVAASTDFADFQARVAAL